MKNVIISGADGFVGSYTAACFVQNGINVLALDLKEAPERLQQTEGLTYLQCNVWDREAMMKQIPQGVYDTFIHFAWEGSAGPQRADYHLQMQNALHTVECMKIAHELGCKRFVCAGSIMEHEAEAVMHAQGSKPGPGILYGIGKHAAHGMCKTVAAEIGMELIWPMITNAYGAGEVSPRFVNTTLRRIIHGEPLQFTSATQHYDFVYVTDVAKAFFLIAENGKPFCEYIIGSSNARPLKEFIREIQQTCAPDAPLHFGSVPFTGIDLPLKVFDPSDTEKDCGFKAEVGFAQGIRMTMEWLKAQSNGGRSCESGI